jgi:hypothetical protein
MDRTGSSDMGSAADKCKEMPRNCRELVSAPICVRCPPRRTSPAPLPQSEEGC